jgi:hypothetical protein
MGFHGGIVVFLFFKYTWFQTTTSILGRTEAQPSARPTHIHRRNWLRLSVTSVMTYKNSPKSFRYLFITSGPAWRCSGWCGPCPYYYKYPRVSFLLYVIRSVLAQYRVHPAVSAQPVTMKLSLHLLLLLRHINSSSCVRTSPAPTTFPQSLSRL